MQLTETEIAQILKKHIGTVSVKSLKHISGGWNVNTLRVETERGDFFLKFHDTISFEVEAKGLEILRSTNSVRIPDTVGLGTYEEQNYMILDYMAPGRRIKNYWERLGWEISTLHKNSQSSFGLDHDNYIGKLPQKNTFKDNWIDFFIECRLLPQMEYAKELLPSQIIDQLEKLFLKLPAIIPVEKPALLHGDLWAENLLTDVGGDPVLIDPAVYYGHREIEIAFTRLFGEFDDEFYEAYQSSSPLEKGFDDRVEIYNIYPLLVHANMFGGGYVQQIQMTLNRIVS